MFLAVIALALSCQPTTILCDANVLFRVDVTIPQREGRKEADDIAFVKTTLNVISGIEVHFAGKVVDNQGLYLVIEVQDMCKWPFLTSALSERGYLLSVTLLEKCSDYAKQLGLDVIYTPLSTLQERFVFLTADLAFTDKSLNGTAYLDQVKGRLALDTSITESGIELQCYTAFIEYPVRLMYIGVSTLTNVEDVAVKVDRMMTPTITLKSGMIQNIYAYDETC